jgi:hypothetical protein
VGWRAGGLAPEGATIVAAGEVRGRPITRTQGAFVATMTAFLPRVAQDEGGGAPGTGGVRETDVTDRAGRGSYR